MVASKAGLQLPRQCPSDLCSIFLPLSKISGDTEIQSSSLDGVRMHLAYTYSLSASGPHRAAKAAFRKQPKQKHRALQVPELLPVPQHLQSDHLPRGQESCIQLHPRPTGQHWHIGIWRAARRKNAANSAQISLSHSPRRPTEQRAQPSYEGDGLLWWQNV